MGAKDNTRNMQNSTSSMRGQIGLRSGPLAPTSAKLTTQYLVLDHMSNHFRKINKAKPAIDNKPPKSMSVSQKARDRKTRDHVLKTGTRPATATRSRPHTAIGYYQDDNIYDENLWGDVDPEDEEGQLIHSIMRTTLRDNTDHAQSPYMTQSHQDRGGFDQFARTRQRPSSARSHHSVMSVNSRTMVGVPQKKGTYDGDVLDKRSHAFTEAKPFTPRTLKTDRKSRLSQYKYYNKNPPKQKAKGSEDHQDAGGSPRERKQVASETKVPPVPKPRQQHQQQRLDRTREGPVTMNSLMFETLHSRDFQQEDNPDIPKLDITMDTDHLKWINEQGSKAKLRQNNDTLKSTMQEKDPYNTSVDFGKTGEMSLTFGTLGSTKARNSTLGSSKKISQEDEEALYVRFMKEVTNEVLDRGIFTDRALRQVFKAHINRNKGHLDELRMHQITDDIRQQLNIPRYDINDDTSLSMTKDAPPTHNGHDDYLDKYMNADRYGKQRANQAIVEDEAGLSGTLEETSFKSKASKVSSDQEQSTDTYNFRNTEDDDLYSTIRSDMNNTANLTLRTYQASINEQEELEEGEIPVDNRHGNPRNGGRHHYGGIPQEGVTVKEVDEDVTDSHRDDDDDEEEDDEYEDDYSDDADDDDDDDGHHTTEPTATYRTDDDDF